jgi:cytochrome b6-f complex iron-sulfur subunit
MDRKDFLALVGTSIGAITLASCLQSCQKQNNSPSQPTVDFTLDLTSSANSALATNGGYLYNSGVIVARTLTGAFIAVAQACTHQGVTVIYQSSANDFFCSAHGSTYSSNGGVTVGPATTALKQYACNLSGSSLHVHG